MDAGTRAFETKHPPGSSPLVTSQERETYLLELGKLDAVAAPPSDCFGTKRACKFESGHLCVIQHLCMWLAVAVHFDEKLDDLVLPRMYLGEVFGAACQDSFAQASYISNTLATCMEEDAKLFAPCFPNQPPREAVDFVG